MAGGYGDKWVTASNVSTIEKSWLGCCPPEIYLTETARIDPHQEIIVWYNVTLKNNAKSTMTTVIYDRIPSGMRFLDSSMVPSNQSQKVVKWMVMDLAPGEVRYITYGAEASRDGRFSPTWSMWMHAWSTSWGPCLADTSVDVVIGQAPVKTGMSGTDSSSAEVNFANEPASDYNWNQEPLAECSGPCPAFSESSD